MLMDLLLEVVGQGDHQEGKATTFPVQWYCFIGTEAVL